MKNVIGFIALLTMFACEEAKYYTPERVIEREVIKEVPAEHKFLYAGYFNLDGGSDANCIYLDEKAENVVDIETDCQSLVTVNPENSTLGQFPSISANNLLVVDGRLKLTIKVYKNANNDNLNEVVATRIFNEL